jgi:hypothetical protein
MPAAARIPQFTYKKQETQMKPLHIPGAPRLSDKLPVTPLSNKIDIRTCRAAPFAGRFFEYPGLRQNNK